MYMPSVFEKDFFDDLDLFFDDAWFDGSSAKKPAKRSMEHRRARNVMNTDVKETKDEYILKIDLPGFKKEEIKVALEDGYMTISAAKHEETETSDKDKETYIRRERIMEACQRSFYVGKDITQEDIKASLKHGVLKLVVPKKEAKPAVEQKNYITIE